MNDDLARWLYAGAQALKEGRRDEARTLLMQVLERDEQNEQAWLWLSGAVDDPADQQIALENVLAINPANHAAQEGLRWLQRQTAGPVSPPAPTGAASNAEWTPPPPMTDDDVRELLCWECGSSLYSVAQFCWQCHAPVHCCNNCTFRMETRCKEIQGLTSIMSQGTMNRCEWWRPK